jgi:hypothetical protein
MSIFIFCMHIFISNSLIIIKTKDLLSSRIGDLRRLWLSCIDPLVRINVREYRRGNKKTKGGQSRKTRNIGYTIRRKTKQKHNTTCVGHHVSSRNVSMVLKQYLSFYRQVHCGTTLLLVFQPIDFERRWWRWFQKSVVHIKFDVYVFISDIDDCIGVDCLNGGSCIDRTQSYICKCVGGFAKLKVKLLLCFVKFHSTIQDCFRLLLFSWCC